MGLALVRRSISTCMRNAVAGFSIMWVYKGARAPSHLEAAVIHILQVENTRSGFTAPRLLQRGVFYEPRGRLFILPLASFDSSIRRGNLYRYRDARYSSEVSTFYGFPEARKMCPNNLLKIRACGRSGEGGYA